MFRSVTLTLALLIALAGLVATPESTLASKKKKNPSSDDPPTTEFSCLYQSDNSLVSLLVDTIPGSPDEGFTLVIAGAEYIAPKLFRSFPTTPIPRSWVAVEASRDIEEDSLIGTTVNGKLKVAIDPNRGLGSFNFIDRDSGIGITRTNVKFDCS
jgi:hypothetical protein